MPDERFRGLATEELADIWYALSGAEIRHTDCFKNLVDAAIAELELREGAALPAFLDKRFAKLRAVDAMVDVDANQSSTIACDSPLES
jgi:hypothetical protein